MYECNMCERALQHVPSLKGSRADKTKLFFLLHKPDSRIEENLFKGKDAYMITLGQTKTGQELIKLLEYCGLTLEDIFLTNFFKCTLPNDSNPTSNEYRNCRKILERQIKEFEPEKIVVFSIKVYHQLEKQPDNGMDKQRTLYNGVPALVMPHLSAIYALLNVEKRQAEYEKIKRFIS